MTLTQLIDNLRTIQAKVGGDAEVWLGQASGPNLPASVLDLTASADRTQYKLTIYPESED